MIKVTNMLNGAHTKEVYTTQELTNKKVSLEKEQSIMRLNTDDLIELAEKGKIRGVFWDEVSQAKRDDILELDDTAKIVLHKCLHLLNFEKKCYEKGKKKNARQI